MCFCFFSVGFTFFVLYLRVYRKGGGGVTVFVVLLSLYLKGKRPICAYKDTDRDTGWVIDPSQNGRFQALAH